MTTRILITSILYLFMTAHASAETIIISDQRQLQDVIASQTKDLHLVLKPGKYGSLILKGKQVPKSISSANPKKPAKFTGFKASSFSGLRLSNLIFDYSFKAGDDARTRPFEFRDFNNLHLNGSIIEGDTARDLDAASNGFPSGVGIWFQDCSGLRVTNNRFEMFHRGLVVFRCQDIEIKRNVIHKIRSDGMNLAEVKNVLISENRIFDFLRSEDSSDHADMIQFWTNGTSAPTSDVVIQGNILNSGSGLYSQSIFMRNDLVDRGLAGDEMFYRNITIEQNLIGNAHLHGITVGETSGLSIKDNVLVQNIASAGPDSTRPLWIPTIRISEFSREVFVQNNFVSSIEGFSNQHNWLVEGNTRIRRDEHSKFFNGTDFSFKNLSEITNVMRFMELMGFLSTGDAL